MQSFDFLIGMSKPLPDAVWILSAPWTSLLPLAGACPQHLSRAAASQATLHVSPSHM